MMRIVCNGESRILVFPCASGSTIEKALGDVIATVAKS
jgi:hypothetical protein